jgi:ABC-2 type transport system permease protein
MLSRILILLKKELIQVKRDKLTLIVIFVFPVFMLILFGYALNFDVKNIKLVIYDSDKSDISREYINSLGKTEYFNVVEYIDNSADIQKILDSKKAQCAVVIPGDLSEKFNKKQDVKIQYLIDGVDGNTALIIMNYVNVATRNLSAKLSSEFLTKSGMKFQQPVDMHTEVWFNPELKTTQFLILGLLSSILVTLSVVMTAVAIVREKELGTIEQINISPVSSIELLIGKIIPYLMLSLIGAAFTLILSYFLFGLIIKGSLFDLLIVNLFYLFACLSLGIFVSSVASSQQVAYQMGIIISQLPANLLSGFIFPIESMPPLIKLLTNITPSKFYIVGIRAVIMRGVSFEAFWQQLIYLIIFALVCLLIAGINLRKQTVR